MPVYAPAIMPLPSLAPDRPALSGKANYFIFHIIHAAYELFFPLLQSYNVLAANNLKLYFQLFLAKGLILIGTKPLYGNVHN